MNDEQPLLDRANALVDEAEALQNLGRHEESADLLRQAETLCDAADEILDGLGVPR